MEWYCNSDVKNENRDVVLFKNDTTYKEKGRGDDDSVCLTCESGHDIYLTDMMLKYSFVEVI